MTPFIVVILLYLNFVGGFHSLRSHSECERLVLRLALQDGDHLYDKIASVYANEHGYRFLGRLGALLPEFALLERCDDDVDVVRKRTLSLLSPRATNHSNQNLFNSNKYSNILSIHPQARRLNERRLDDKRLLRPSTPTTITASSSSSPYPSFASPHTLTAADLSWPEDPLVEAQWHLEWLNVSAAWKAGVNGKGMQVAIVDDGIQFTHIDLEENFSALGSYDFNEYDADVYPNAHPHARGLVDNHGTPAAGLCCAVRNGAPAGDRSSHAGQTAYCGVGVAHRARVAAIRLLGEPSTEDHQNAMALSHELQVNDVFSNSWGPPDDGHHMEGPDMLSELALERAVQVGRGGRGTVFVWAGGNGKNKGDSCNYDGWANHRYTITVASVSDRGKQAWYSEECAAILLSSPSSGGSAKISSTDLVGSSGLDQGPCTSRFSGTSASAPIIAGLVALVLQANPALSWRDVQGVLIDSARPIDRGRGEWQKTGAHRWLSSSSLLYSHKYGFGMANAGRAIELARHWSLFSDALVRNSSELVINRSLTPLKERRASFDFGQHSNELIEHVDVYLNLKHPRRGQVTIYLVAPNNVTSIFAQARADTHSDYPAGWRFTSIAHWGLPLSVKGSWTLKVKVEKKGKEGKWLSWSIALHTRKTHRQTLFN